MLGTIRGYSLDRKLAVYGKDFDFIFMPPYDNREYDFRESIKDNYLWMETKSGQRIAIHFPQFTEVHPGKYTGESKGFFQFVNFQSDPLPDHITEIKFSGGILDYLFDGSRGVLLREGEDILTAVSREKLEYTVTRNGLDTPGKIIIGVQQREVDFNDFNQLKTKEVYMAYQFDNAVALNVVLDFFSLTLLLARFMSNSYEVGFREINVTSTVGRVKYPDGTLYFKKQYDDQNQAPGFNITFQDLGWMLINLLAIFTRINMTKKRKGPDFALGFIPRSNETGYMDNETICSISGSLEYEASQHLKDNTLKNADVQAFGDAVLKWMKQKETQAQYNLTQGAMSVIAGSIRNWSLPAKERFAALENMFKDAVEILINQSLGKEYYDIGKFVKYRNSLMHDAAMPSTIEVRNTATVLRGLVYCSILNRAGMSEDMITQLCREGRINT